MKLYALTPASDGGSKDQYGTEAVETLMKRMEDDRGKYIVIAAGYKTEMERFLRLMTVSAAGSTDNFILTTTPPMN
jgi:septum formation inhibitor-activating ATPase MinD